jgi:hypothetical protein
MTVSAFPARLFVTPTTAATGGTHLLGINERRITFDDGRRGTLVKPSLRHNSFAVWGHLRQPATLRFECVAGDDLLGLLFPMSGGVGGDSGVKEAALLPSTAIVVRPYDPARPLIYAPNWQWHPDSVARIVAHPTEGGLDGSELILIASDPGDDVEPWLRGTAAAIDEEYDLGDEEEEGEGEV